MEHAIRILDLLRPWEAACVAALVALLAGLAARLTRSTSLATVAAGLAVLAGWWFAFGLLTASPRQLPERLPLLVLVLVIATPVLALLAQRWPWMTWPCAVLGALWAGWWMAGAPMVLPDLRRGAPVLACIALATLLIAARSGPRWAGPVAAASLCAGILAAAPPGPYRLLAAVLAAAAFGAALIPPRGVPPAPLGALVVASATAALGALPVIARGAAADWAAAAAPIAALWLGAPLGAMLLPRAGGVVVAILLGAACAGVALLLR